MNRKKMRNDMGSLPVETKIGKVHVLRNRGQGGNVKLRLVATDIANVADPKTGKIKKVKIITVKDNRANPHFVRRNIITKGAVIETEAGLAKVTSRPGQDGAINAVLLEKK
jgi:small subunit ribosomal protein S8e